MSSVKGEFLWIGTVVLPEQQLLLSSQLIPLSDRFCLKITTAAIPIFQSTNPPIILCPIGKDQDRMVVTVTSLWQSSCILTAMEESSLSDIDFCPQECGLLFRRFIKCISYKHAHPADGFQFLFFG